jgi:multiple sugar transport system ATP-binding protein
VRDPAAYLMDDPISALDARLREETRVELKRIQRELGKTLIYVTHDQEEAMSVADRMAILEDGRIRQIGAPVDIYDRPASIYVARLLGSPMINMLSTAKVGKSGSGRGSVAPTPKGRRMVEIGVRPEDMQGQSLGRRLHGRPATVFEVEPLGGYTVVTLDAGATAVSRAAARTAADPADELVWSIASAIRVHFFGLAALRWQVGDRAQKGGEDGEI